MVTGKLRRFEGVRRRAPRAFSRNPERNARRIRPPLMLVWRLAGWFARSLPRRLLILDCFSQAWQERGLQSGATKICSEFI